MAVRPGPELCRRAVHARDHLPAGLLRRGRVRQQAERQPPLRQVLQHGEFRWTVNALTSVRARQEL